MTMHAVSQPTATPLEADELARIDAWWRAANYLSVGQIYLMDNPLLREPLRPEHVKPRLLGHWGTTPGLNFLYAHLNRAIMARDLDMMYVIGPGHGGPGPGRVGVPRGHLHRDLPRHHPRRGRDAAAVQAVLLPRRHPQPRGTRDPRVDPRGRRARLLAVPRVRCGVRQPGPGRRGRRRRRRGGDRVRWRPAGTAPSSSTRARDGAVLPILHLNGYKIANPTILARIPDDELDALLRGYGHTPYVVSGDDPDTMHQAFAATLDRCLDEIRDIQERGSATGGLDGRPSWPMIVLRSPKGWTGPEGGRRRPDRGLLALPPGALRRRARQRGPPADPRGVDAQLPARGALRRRPAPRSRTSSACAPTAARG